MIFEPQPQLYKRLIEEYSTILGPTKSLSEYIYLRIRHISNIAEKTNEAIYDMNIIRKKFAKDMEVFEKRLLELQNYCSHEQFTIIKEHNEDGSDYKKCNICQKEL